MEVTRSRAERWKRQRLDVHPAHVSQAVQKGLTNTTGAHRLIMGLQGHVDDVRRGEISCGRDHCATDGKVSHLLDIVAIKQLCRKASVEKVDAGPGGATLAFRDDRFPDPAGLVAFISDQADTIKLRPDHRLVYMRRWDTAEMRLGGVRNLMTQLAKIAQSPAA